MLLKTSGELYLNIKLLRLLEILHNKNLKYILRSIVVFLESTFDFFVHEIAKYGLLQFYKGNWIERKEEYISVELSVRSFLYALNNKDEEKWLAHVINESYSTKTLVSYKSFKQVCRLLEINIKNIAENAFSKYIE